jgi:TPR repeat protein
MMKAVAVALLVLVLFSLTVSALPRDLSSVRSAAERGEPEAEKTLGVYYELGLTVRQDTAEAVKWYRLAAEHGNAEAQFSLGDMYEEGRGVPQDKSAARSWFEKACGNGLSCGCRRARSLLDQGY